MNQNIYIISGGTSFIGLYLINFLLMNGQRVICLCRNIDKARQKLHNHSNLKFVCCDMDDIDVLPQLVEHADVFIHLAWMGGTSPTNRDNKELQKKNVIQSLKAVTIASKIGCSLFVEAGSQAEYGLIKDEISESTPCHPENEYGKAKALLGIKAESLCALLNMKFIHLRILSVYGEGDKDWTMIATCVRKMLRDDDIQLSEATQLWNYVYIKDAVKQIALLCTNALNNKKFISEIYMIGSKDTRQLKQFIEEIYLITKSHSKLLYGYYKPINKVELNPDMTKTELATGGFISEHSFAEGIKNIINDINK